MLIIRLVMVHMGPKHTQYGQKTARLAPVLQNGLKGHVGALRLPVPEPSRSPTGLLQKIRGFFRNIMELHPALRTLQVTRVSGKILSQQF